MPRTNLLPESALFPKDLPAYAPHEEDALPLWQTILTARKVPAIYRIFPNGFIGGENFHVKNFRLQSWVQEIVRIMVVRWHADLRMNYPAQKSEL